MFSVPTGSLLRFLGKATRAEKTGAGYILPPPLSPASLFDSLQFLARAAVQPNGEPVGRLPDVSRSLHCEAVGHV